MASAACSREGKGVAAGRSFNPADATEGARMNRDQMEGKGKEGAGQLKETAGNLMGDRETEASGKADQAEGKGQGALGKAKDAAGDVLDKVKS